MSEETECSETELQGVNEDNPYYGAVGGNGDYQPGDEWYPSGGSDTQDKVYLLSLSEVEKYFGVGPSEWGRYVNGDIDGETYVVLCNEKNEGILLTENPVYGGEYWWLRSPGFHKAYVAFVENGGVVVDGSDSTDNGGVRPVIRVGLLRLHHSKILLQ
ncbi:MAG: DUF6273 domain-containing protein [Lachnospiraceae bacterium]|nr:DUF6273 domain-containing protein [Lachnospiraceae bacterium]